MKSVILFFVVGIAFCLHGNAQESWTLEACVLYACENNLAQQTETYDTAIEKEVFLQSKRSFLPEIHAVSNLNRRFGRYVDPNSNTVINTATSSNSYGMTASLQLFNNFKKWHQISQKRIRYHASLAGLLEAKYQLTFAVMDAFYLVKFRKYLLDITKEKLEISKMNHSLITSKIKLGLVAKSYLYDIESELSADTLQIIQAQNQLEEATLDLVQIMNFPGEEIPIEMELLEENSEEGLSVDSIFAKAVTFVPSIRQQELYVSASEKQLTIIKSSLYPSVSLNAGWRSGYFETNRAADGEVTPFFAQLTNNASKFVGVSLSIPITDKWSKHTQVKIAKIHLEKEKNTLAQKKQELYKEIQKIIRKNKTLVSERNQSKLNLKTKEVALTFVQKKMVNGLATMYELAEAKNNLIQAKMEQTRINLQLAYQKKVMAFYAGIAIFPFKY